MNKTEMWRSVITHFYERYSSIQVNEFKASTPYWMNDLNNLADSKSVGPYNGKALPEEVEYCCRLYLKENGIELKSDADLREKLEKMRIGIDCSGYVYHILSAIIRFEVRSNYPSKPNYYPEDVIVGIDKSGRLRRVNADVLTSESNGWPVSIDSVRTGDLMRWKAGKHVGIVLDVSIDGVTVTHSTARCFPTGPRIDRFSLSDIDSMEADLDSNPFWRLRVLAGFIDDKC